MHIEDSLLPEPVWIGGAAVAGVATGVVLRRLRDSDMPRVAVMTSLFFAVSYIHLPGLHVHLVLNGLMGVLLGWLAVPAILIGLGFQLLLLGHGGLTTLGINTLNLASGAIFAHYAFRLAGRSPGRAPKLAVALGAFVGGAAVLVSVGLYFLCLLSMGESFHAAVEIAVLTHLPVAGVEAVVTGSAVAYLAAVRPELLARPRGGRGVGGSKVNLAAPLFVTTLVLFGPGLVRAHSLEVDYEVAGRELTIEVYYAPNELLEGVRITVSASGEGVIARGTTDHAGKAEFSVPDGLDAVMLKVEHAGHKSYVEVAMMAENEFRHARGWTHSLGELAIGVALILGLCGIVMVFLKQRAARNATTSD